MRRRFVIASVLAALIGSSLVLVPAVPAAAVPATVDSGFHALGLTRVVDTRSGDATPIGPGGHLDLAVGARAGVPVDWIGAVWLQVSVIDATRATSVAVAPRGAPRPTIGAIVPTVGGTTTRGMVVPLDADGWVTVHNRAGTVDIAVDLTGWFSVDGGFTSLSRRSLDTRRTATPLAAGQRRTIQVGARDAAQAPLLLAVSALDAAAATDLAVHAPGRRRSSPSVSAAPGHPGTTLAVVRPDATGRVTVANGAGAVHVVVDVIGRLGEEAAYVPLADPARLLDTRNGPPVSDHRTRSYRDVPGIPDHGVRALVLDVTAVDATGPGVLSNRSFQAGAYLTYGPGHRTTNQVVAASTYTGLFDEQSDPTVAFSVTGAPTHLVVDIVGWIPDGRLGPVSFERIGGGVAPGPTPATTTRIRALSLAVDPTGSTIVDADCGCIRHVDAASGQQRLVPSPFTISSSEWSASTVLPGGERYVADGSAIWKLHADGSTARIAGSTPGFGGDGGPATDARFDLIEAITLAVDGSLFVADGLNHRIRRIGPDGIVTTVAGGGSGSGESGPATSAALLRPTGVAIAGDGAVLIAERYRHRISRVAPDGSISRVAGTGVRGISDDGGQATASPITSPEDVAALPGGGFVFTDTGSFRVRMVNGAGVLTTIAGRRDVSVSAGDGGPATAATVGFIGEIEVAPDGRVVFADGDLGGARPNQIRVAQIGGSIQRLAGVDGPIGGLGLPADQAQFPVADLAGAPDGSVYIATGTDALLLVIRPDGRLERATDIRMTATTTVAVDAGDGRIYLGDEQAGRVRRFSAEGTIEALFRDVIPRDLAVEDGTLYVLEHGAQRVRLLDATTGVVREDVPTPGLDLPTGIAVRDGTLTVALTLRRSEGPRLFQRTSGRRLAQVPVFGDFGSPVVLAADDLGGIIYGGGGGLMGRRARWGESVPIRATAHAIAVEPSGEAILATRDGVFRLVPTG